MAGRVRLSVVGAAGTLPSKCSKCTVDAVVLVEPRHAALARAAINKLRLKVKDVERVKLVLKSAVREHAVGTELPCGEADLSSYLATDCVVAVSVMDAPRPAPLPAAPPPQAVHEGGAGARESMRGPGTSTATPAPEASAAPPGGDQAAVTALDVFVMADVLGMLSGPMGVRAVFALASTCTAVRAAVSECASGPWWREACEQWSPLLQP